MLRQLLCVTFLSLETPTSMSQYVTLNLVVQLYLLLISESVDHLHDLVVATLTLLSVHKHVHVDQKEASCHYHTVKSVNDTTFEHSLTQLICS